MTHDAVNTLVGSLVIQNGSQSGHILVTLDENGEFSEAPEKEIARKHKGLRAL